MRVINRSINATSKPIATERGWAGHYICARHCLFRRNTLISFNGKSIVVSTVGNHLDSLSNQIIPFSDGDHYETMCFESDYSCPYLDADVSQYIEIPNTLLRFLGSDKDTEANQQHENIVSYFIDNFPL